METRKNSQPIRVGIIGTGNMANKHAEIFLGTACELVAACDLRPTELAEFADKHEIPERYVDYNEMLRRAELDAVSIVTPDATHTPIAIAALEAGLHVLCEKPLAMNYPDALRMCEAARASGTVNMVNFSYREAAAFTEARRRIAAGELGEIVHIEGSYLQSWLSSKVWGDWRTEPAWLWRLSTEHGSKGVLGDVGVHLVDFALEAVRAAAGEVQKVHCKLKTFSQLKGQRRGDYKLDANDSAVLSLEFANGALASLHSSRWATGHVNSVALAVYGSKGALRIELDKSWTALQICDSKGVDEAKWHTEELPKAPTNHARFIAAIGSRASASDSARDINEQPDFAAAAKVNRILDACFLSDRAQRTVAIDEVAAQS